MTSPADISAHDLIWDIEQQHLREAEFLFEIREAVLDAPHYAFGEFEAGPERLLAHVDALVIGRARVADQLLITTIEDESQVEDFERIAAASLAVFAQPRPDSYERALTVLDHGGDAQRAGISRALQLTVGGTSARARPRERRRAQGSAKPRRASARARGSSCSARSVAAAVYRRQRACARSSCGRARSVQSRSRDVRAARPTRPSRRARATPHDPRDCAFPIAAGRLGVGGLLGVSCGRVSVSTRRARVGGVFG